MALYHGILNYYTFQHPRTTLGINDSSSLDHPGKSLRLDPAHEPNIPKLLAGSTIKESLEEAIKLVRLLILTSFIVDRREPSSETSIGQEDLSNTKRLVNYINLVQKQLSQSQQTIIMQQVEPLLGQANISADTQPVRQLDEISSSDQITQPPGHQRLGGGSGIPTTDTHVASNIDTRQSTTAGSRGRKSRVLELEQEVSKLLSINEHQQAAMRDLEEVATKQKQVLESLHYYSDSSSDEGYSGKPFSSGGISNKKMEKMKHYMAAQNTTLKSTRRKSNPVYNSSNDKLVEDRDSVIESLESQVASLLESNKLLQKTANELASQIESLKTRDVVRENELSNLQQQYADACDEIYTFQRTELTANRYRRKVEELQGEIEELKEKLLHSDGVKEEYPNSEVGDIDLTFSNAEEFENLHKNNEALQKALDESRHRESQLLALLASIESNVANTSTGASPSATASPNRQSSLVSSRASVFGGSKLSQALAPGSSGSAASANSGTSNASASSSQSNRSVRPLINHYEVLMKHAGFSAARWKVLMDRAGSNVPSAIVTSGSNNPTAPATPRTSLAGPSLPGFGSSSTSSSPNSFSRSSKDNLISPIIRPSSVNPNSETPTKRKAREMGSHSLERISKESLNNTIEDTKSSAASTIDLNVSPNLMSATTLTAPVLSTGIGLGLGINGFGENREDEKAARPIPVVDDTHSFNTESTMLGSYQSQSDGIASSMRENNDRRDSDIDDLSKAISSMVLSQSRLSSERQPRTPDDASETVQTLKTQNEELETQNTQLREELELMAAAWKSLAFKFQELQEQQMEQMNQTLVESSGLDVSKLRKDSIISRLSSRSASLNGSAASLETAKDAVMKDSSEPGDANDKKDSQSRGWSWGSMLMLSREKQKKQLEAENTEPEAKCDSVSACPVQFSNITATLQSDTGLSNSVSCGEDDDSNVTKKRRTDNSGEGAQSIASTRLASKGMNQDTRIGRYHKAKSRPKTLPTSGANNTSTLSASTRLHQSMSQCKANSTWMAMQRGRVIGYTYF